METPWTSETLVFYHYTTLHGVTTHESSLLWKLQISCLYWYFSIITSLANWCSL